MTLKRRVQALERLKQRSHRVCPVCGDRPFFTGDVGNHELRRCPVCNSAKVPFFDVLMETHLATSAESPRTIEEINQRLPLPPPPPGVVVKPSPERRSGE